MMLFSVPATHNKGTHGSQSVSAAAAQGSTPISLCMPAPDLTCFGCCPPIRPAGYDPIHYVSSLRRIFRDNRREFFERPPAAPHPIVGYHCWALGHLDDSGRRVGCLLHPAQNGGRDLRHLTDFAWVCAGEQCFPAQTFAALPPQARRFWLPLAVGLSPFYYSSRTANPLFHLLLWGGELLEQLRAQASENGWSATELLWHCPTPTDRAWRPRAHRYLFRKALAAAGGAPVAVAWSAAAARAKRVLSVLARRPDISRPRTRVGPSGYVHQLAGAGDLADFLRLTLGWRDRVKRAQVERIDQWIDSELARVLPVVAT